MPSIESLLIHETRTVREAMQQIDAGEKGIVLVVDEAKRLIATVTDGDVRRGILRGLDLSRPISDLLAISKRTAPLSAPVGVPPETLMTLLTQRRVRQIPLLNDAGQVVDMVMAEDLDLGQPPEVPLQAVIMAGGFGKRLRPLTEDLPKPMLPLNDRPIMEHIVDQLRGSGIQKVSVTTHHLAEKIVEYFGDGSRFGVDMDYVQEDEPCGTAGSLALMDPPNRTTLVINGDVLTSVNLRAMLVFHQQQGAELTVGLRHYDFQVPFGVVECEDARITALVEKPSYSFFVNAGVYLLEPAAHAEIPKGRRFDMTDLVQQLIDQQRHVAGFPIVEYWMDVGRMDDYQQAQRDQRAREQEGSDEGSR